MRVPSKIQSKYLAIAFLIILLLVFPFRDFIKNTLVFFSKQLVLSRASQNRKLRALERKNLSLTLAIRNLTYLKNENLKLKEALQFKAERKISLIGAEIIAFDPSNWRRFAIVNAGQDSGIKKGAYAIDEKGYLVGRVAEVKKNYSYVMLVDDPDFSLPVFIGEGALGMLKGTLGGVDIFYIEQEDRIKVKDKVWAKVANLAFPIYIGEVLRIKKDANSLFLGVEVFFFSQESLLHEVFIIK